MISKLLSRLSAASIEYEKELSVDYTDQLEDESDESFYDDE